MAYFTGNPDNRPHYTHPDSPAREPYLASEELITAVNLSIFLQRPLLLEGESGCGKTRLASAVAHELGYPLYRWNIRSKTRYQEGLYEYDALLRLHDVNLSQKIEAGTVEGDRTIDPSQVGNYLDFKALGQAFRLQESPAVVLIDEIDKADLDFPNDLLTVLEKPYAFKVKETGETITAQHPPIVIITSNKEKGNLPAPFLRRCIYHFVEFPGKAEQLKQIVDIHFNQPEQQSDQQSIPTEALVDTAVDQFLTIRQQKGLSKLPGTSEFLDWLGALTNFGAEPYPAEQLKAAPVVPYRDLLFKLRNDWKGAESAL